MTTEPFDGDVELLASLINSAYRGESSRIGWTTEADILDGKRCDKLMLQNILKDKEQVILVMKEQELLLGCVHLAKETDTVSTLGMYAVNPLYQGRGIGKSLMLEAESYVKKVFASTVMRMGIINYRTDIIPFYERRGYQNTFQTIPFPASPLWQPKVEGLELMIYEKILG